MIIKKTCFLKYLVKYIVEIEKKEEKLLVQNKKPYAIGMVRVGLNWIKSSRCILVLNLEQNQFNCESFDSQFEQSLHRIFFSLLFGYRKICFF